METSTYTQYGCAGVWCCGVRVRCGMVGAVGRHTSRRPGIAVHTFGTLPATVWWHSDVTLLAHFGWGAETSQCVAVAPLLAHFITHVRRMCACCHTFVTLWARQSTPPKCGTRIPKVWHTKKIPIEFQVECGSWTPKVWHMSQNHGFYMVHVNVKPFMSFYGVFLQICGGARPRLFNIYNIYMCF